MKYSPLSVEIINAPMPTGEQFPDLARMVEYDKHPAYQHLIETAGLGLRARALSSFAMTFATLLIKRILRYEMIPSDVRASGGLVFIKHGIRNALRLERSVSSVQLESKILTSLESHGVAVVKIDQLACDRLQNVSVEHFKMLVARRKSRGNAKRHFDESRSSASRHAEPALFTTIETLLRETGIMAAASAYLGREAQLADVNPQVNDSTDSFWRDIFPDISETQLPPTAYFHRDASGGDLKAIFYLSDVGTKNGPFTYVLGSHRAKIRRIDDLICEANDHRLSATDKSSRSLFAALPKSLRKKGAFGNDVLPGSETANKIAARSWSIEGEAGSIVVFDTKGVHRGGMVESGERRVITCVLG